MSAAGGGLGPRDVAAQPGLAALRAGVPRPPYRRGTAAEPDLGRSPRDRRGVARASEAPPLGHRSPRRGRRGIAAFRVADRIFARGPPGSPAAGERTCRAAAVDRAVLRPGRLGRPCGAARSGGFRRVHPELPGRLRGGARPLRRPGFRVPRRWRAGLFRASDGERGRRRSCRPRRARAGGGGWKAGAAGTPRASAPGSVSRPAWWWSGEAPTGHGIAARLAGRSTWRPDCRGSPSRARSSSMPARGGFSRVCSNSPISAPWRRRACQDACEPGGCCARAGPSAAAPKPSTPPPLLLRWLAATRKWSCCGAAGSRRWPARAGWSCCRASLGSASRGSPPRWWRDSPASRMRGCGTSARRIIRTAPSPRLSRNWRARRVSIAATRRKRGSASSRRCSSGLRRARMMSR